ncbi:hypothetical protein RGR602_PC01702 (plasmid) [Rhizobium gallicum bv. gallicum R602sp]|uniref:Uncharacterized protein n=1 Tax=Rhizobium gallicum bv. gallicum R602sp TaxID=1041138 RepID=A0A0B4XF58_9HYPH|nr:hypothetical protein RGR602_PC01702 [Rhizobium gallicum bv. gallicum R602sp]
MMISANYCHSLLRQNRCMASVPSMMPKDAPVVIQNIRFPFGETVARRSDVAYL